MGIRSSAVNEEYQDPVVFIQFDGYRDAILFDCGYIFSLRLRDIQRVCSIFVSHTHFDHFMGFDQFLRMNLEQDRTVELYGPAHFIRQVACKLGGYTWNLCEGIKLDFLVRELTEDTIKESLLKGKEAYELKGETAYPLAGGCIKDEPLYTVSAAVLDHRTPSLAFSIEEKNVMRVRKEELERFGLEPGPWLKELKEKSPSAAECRDEVVVGNKRFRRIDLEKMLLEEKRGKKISFVVDTIFNKVTAKKIKALIRESDEFYCEMSYLTSEKEKAMQNFHLTAKQAAILAHEAGVKKLIPIHFSKRYDKRYDELIEEARAVFPHVERSVRYDR